MKPKIQNFWRKANLMWYFIGNFDKQDTKKAVKNFTSNIGNSG